MKKPFISIIIPTRNSAWIIETALMGIKNQTCDSKYIETIIADNESNDSTKQLASKYGARFITIKGIPPLVCTQRNIGADRARGDYLLFLDHDVELSPNLLSDFLESLKSKKNSKIDAWHLPYQNKASSFLLTQIRNFEDEFYLDSVVAAARLVKKSFVIEHKIKYDIELSSGPADWDYDIQLKRAHATFGNLSQPVFHHEEKLSFWQHISKKGNYKAGGNIYREKWMKTDPDVYENIVRKQYDPLHRLFYIFVEKGKWKKLIFRIHTYVMFLIMKVLMGLIYLK